MVSTETLEVDSIWAANVYFFRFKVAKVSSDFILGKNFYAVMADIGAVKGWHAIAQTALLEKPLLTLNHGVSAQGMPSNLLFYH